MNFREKIKLRAANYIPAPLVNPMLGVDPAAEPKRILVVDDDPIILKTLTMKLQVRGYQVVTACDGSEALTAARREKPDLVLLDVNLKPEFGSVDWSGFTLARWFHHIGDAEEMPVMLMSGWDRGDYVEHAADSGAVAFFHKPVEDDQLFAAVEMALCGKARRKTVDSEISIGI